MSQSTYQHLFTGSTIDVFAIKTALAEASIRPVVKDESESARLAGFGATAPMMQRVFVHRDEFDKASEILSNLL